MKTIFLSFILIFVLFSCKREKPCTEEFRMLIVTIGNQNGTPKTPDAWYVVFSAYGDTLLTHKTTPYNDSHLDGIAIFTDTEMKFTNNEGGELFKFTAYQDTIEIINEDYLIRHDNCHFELVAGKTHIQL